MQLMFCSQSFVQQIYMIDGKFWPVFELFAPTAALTQPVDSQVLTAWAVPGPFSHKLTILAPILLKQLFSNL